MKIATVGLDLAKIVRLRGGQTDEGPAAMAMGSAVLLFAAIFGLRDRTLSTEHRRAQLQRRLNPFWFHHAG